MRVGLAGKGKRGGARVIYYYHSDVVPLFLLVVFAKDDKSDLTAAERASLAKAALALKSSYRRQQ